MGDSTDLDISSSQDDRSTLDKDYDPLSQSSSEVTDDQPSVRRVPRSRTMEAEGLHLAAGASDEGQGDVVVEERDGAGRGGDTNAAMLPMTSSQVHLWSIGLWMLIGVLIISPTAGGGGLGRLRCNVDSEGGKYTSASPRCTCLPPRQHCAEVALGAFTTDSSAMLTRREASTPRLRLGVLASLLVNIALKLHSVPLPPTPLQC